MTKSLHRHKKTELIAIIQDYQEAISEIESTLNSLLAFKHPIHTHTGLLEIRGSIEKHIIKEPDKECA